ncbi:TadE/TadG family type IV pilus assembly protein [Salipiger mangrovisoli]|uniref:TadE-like protein n=1 Tax=Salipiger mangrovisoli TaxID=2865933 RepID=A0ABR9X7I4_9RHOB|nr:hypothetical protein [Salipiger mangrovisoli]MBE9639492.1 hypothetical protein [Salipiger mangrovisoli]
MTRDTLTKRLSRFARDTKGTVTLEAMIVMPILLVIFAACWVYFDVFREYSVNQKANYVIGDALSRETDEINDTYIDNSYKLLKLFTRTSDDLYDEDAADSGFVEGDAYPTDLRITVVSYKAKNDKYSVEWSVVRGDPDPLTDSDLTKMRQRLPLLADAAQVILVETWDDYFPLFRVGLNAFPIITYSFTQPRYAPQLLYASRNGNNGWGNGDQDAAGNSLCNNNAENATDCDNSDGTYNNEPSWGDS